jgi:sec-independent protein translocase protein TatA
MPFGLGVTEVIVVLVIALFLFGHKLPEAARWLGKSFVEFKKEATNLTQDLTNATTSTPAPKAPARNENVTNGTTPRV